MTLLELLRQELPKRGGWPEGAVCFVQDIDGFVAGYKCKPMSGHNGIWDGDGYLNESGWWSKMLPRDRETAIVTREQYEATGWDGTNLPPVGCECEHHTHSGVVTVVQIIAHFKNRAAMVAAYIPVKGDVKQVRQSVAGCFRPLRTEAERAIDEMVQLSGVSIGAAKILYDAGYRKG